MSAHPPESATMHYPPPAPTSPTASPTVPSATPPPARRLSLSLPLPLQFQLPDLAHVLLKLRPHTPPPPSSSPTTPTLPRSQSLTHALSSGPTNLVGPAAASSGPTPLTHRALLAPGAVALRAPAALVRADTFVVHGAVDVRTLLRAARAALLERAARAGADVLVEESWTCAVRGPSKGGVYRVQIEYKATPARAAHPAAAPAPDSPTSPNPRPDSPDSPTTPTTPTTPAAPAAPASPPRPARDPGRPVALDRARALSVPGLMTIAERL